MWKFIEDVVDLFQLTLEGIFFKKKIDLILLAIAILEDDEHPTQPFIVLILALLEKQALKIRQNCKKISPYLLFFLKYVIRY